MKIDKFIDFFIAPHHLNNSGSSQKAHLFVRACLLTSLFSTSYVLLSLFFGFDKGVYLMLFNVAGFFLLPFLAKTKMPISWLGNIYVSIGAFAVIVLTYFSGGVWSAIYPWIISIPVLALLVVNRLSGAIWGGISFIVMIWFAYYAYMDVDFPIEYNQEYKTLWYISIIPGLLLIILFISFVFEYNQSKALTDLEQKNAQLESQKRTIAKQSSKLAGLIEEKDYIISVLAHDLRNPLKILVALYNLFKRKQIKIDKRSMLK